MRIDVVAGDQLSADEIATWSRMQRDDPAIDSPYFRPEFTQAVASVRQDVEVGIIEHEGEIQAFFPFQRRRRNVGVPVGSRLCDYHGIIARKGFQPDMKTVVSGCGLATWDFGRLVASQTSFAPYCHAMFLSAFMDVTGGLEGYIKRRAPEWIREPARRARKIQREIGPLRFEMKCDDHQVMQTLRRWKSEQYRRSGIVDVFSFPWIVELVERIWHARDEAFGGILSALYVGDRLAAAHMGMRSQEVLHLWFPVYTPEFAKYSIGAILTMETIKTSPAWGITRMDLGRVRERDYKRHYMTGTAPMALGSVECRPLVRIAKAAWQGTRQWLRRSPMRKPLTAPAAAWNRIMSRSQLR